MQKLATKMEILKEIHEQIDMTLRNTRNQGEHMLEEEGGRL